MNLQVLPGLPAQVVKEVELEKHRFCVTLQNVVSPAGGRLQVLGSPLVPLAFFSFKVPL